MVSLYTPRGKTKNRPDDRITGACISANSKQHKQRSSNLIVKKTVSQADPSAVSSGPNWRARYSKLNQSQPKNHRRVYFRQLSWPPSISNP
ncbi:MAG: hypothetical protein V1656_01140 [Candidatus Jorgensenbacteria bacterium]